MIVVLWANNRLFFLTQVLGFMNITRQYPLLLLALRAMSLFFLLIRYSLGSLLLGLFRLISPKLRLRARQERDSLKKLSSDTVFEKWYHCSSEGEFEQIWPAVQRALKDQSGNQLIWFTSPSLFKKAEFVNSEYEKIQMVLLPLVSLFPGPKHPLRMVAPKAFFMVRYDFFVELIFIGSLKVERFILLGATFKAKISSLLKNPLKRAFAKSLYASFDEIYFSTQKDLDFFKGNLSRRQEQNLFNHDFRHGQILARQNNQENVDKTHCLESFKVLVDKFEFSDRLIFGSMWAKELTLFNNDFVEALRNEECFVLIAPHLLKGQEWDNFNSWMHSMQEQGLKAVLWDHVGIHGEGNIILCQQPGLLCELYPFFAHSFVGGGHGRSVHSLLEPFWGGGHIYCGPKVMRSTEHDFVVESSPAHMHIVVELKDFYDNFKTKRLFPLDRGIREELASQVLINQENTLNSFCSKNRI